MAIGLINKLNHEMTSYKTRTSSYGDPTGCMDGTRIKVLKDLDTWASDANGSKVYWMAGMAGIGKSTIAHTFCEILEAKNMLSGSFFASRASDKTNNARLIIPVIAHALARSSPPITYKVVKAIENDPTLAEPTYSNMRKQFKQLVSDPIQTSAGMLSQPYKVVVIDAVDECGNLEVVASFIELVLESASEIPLKVFISSREEFKIINAFSSRNHKAKNLRLHDIEKDVVQEDIQKYLEASLANIRDKVHDRAAEASWPLQSEVESLVSRCGTLFIYAATIIRYIANGDKHYKSRLSEMAKQGLESVTTFQTNIDVLYIHILELACKEKPLHEVVSMRNIISIIVFLRNPLPIRALESLSEMDALAELSQLTSVIHVPDAQEAPVAPFHASFPDFISNSARCSPDYFSSKHSIFHALDASEGHKLLALKCLKLMNKSLKYNMCGIPAELTQSHRDRINSPENVHRISRAVQYACIYWGSHLAEIKVFDQELADAVHILFHEHLLHWIECLSILGELQTGLKSLSSIGTILLVSNVLE
jgi:nucleoside-triphosphatase THEP1